MVSGSERQSYVTSLVQLVVIAAQAAGLAAGPAGSPAYTTAYNASFASGVANLLTQAQALASRIAGGSNVLESISIPGQSSKWVVEMSLQEQLSANLEAWNQCNGQNMIVRRTTARYFN